MNTPNNKRRRASQEKIESSFIQLLQTQSLAQITVTELCRMAGVNRTTFYANYLDVYDLAESVQKKLEEEVWQLYQEERDQRIHSYNFLKLFQHISENQAFYKTYFKLGVDNRYLITEYAIWLTSKYHDDPCIEYRVEFFRNGLNAVIKKWLDSDCRESPEEIFAIIQREYTDRL